MVVVVVVVAVVVAVMVAAACPWLPRTPLPARRRTEKAVGAEERRGTAGRHLPPAGASGASHCKTAEATAGELLCALRYVCVEAEAPGGWGVVVADGRRGSSSSAAGGGWGGGSGLAAAGPGVGSAVLCIFYLFDMCDLTRSVPAFRSNRRGGGALASATGRGRQHAPALGQAGRPGGGGGGHSAALCCCSNPLRALLAGWVSPQPPPPPPPTADCCVSGRALGGCSWVATSGRRQHPPPAAPLPVAGSHCRLLGHPV